MYYIKYNNNYLSLSNKTEFMIAYNLTPSLNLIFSITSALFLYIRYNVAH